ncbi:MAG: hypothetical protein D3906_07490 [Candidatus Electrothrix sp. AUS1_2]|nr:hypothetical protein [Candidatus Electrothrix sp. AUS1_2]
MKELSDISHKEAMDRLKRFGITNEKVYLIDLILLIEMMWADGLAQQGEIEILENYLEKHVDNVNKRAGCKVLRVQDARDFVKPHLDKRPDPEKIKSLRELVKPISFAVPSDINQKLKDELLHVCMDVGAIATTEYPYEPDERFNKEEKQCFFEILQALS